MKQKNKKRRKISAFTEAKLLELSARRCCICYAINHDFKEKEGQIAHLDKNPSNNELDNLGWLCLEHHNRFDSKTSQSKNYQIHEVKNYRKELYNYNSNLKGSVKQIIETKIALNNIPFANGITNSNIKYEFISIKKDRINTKDRDFLIANNIYYHIIDWYLLKWLIGINRKIKITNLEEQKRYEDESYFNQYQPGEENLDQWNFGVYIDLKMDDEFYICAYYVLSYLIMFDKPIMITEIQTHLKDKDNLNYNELLLDKVMYYLTINDFVTDGKIMNVMAYHITPLGIKASQEGLYKHLPSYIVKEEWENMK